MADLKDQLRRYIDGLEDPVSARDTMSRSKRQRSLRAPVAVLAGAAVVLIPALVLVGLRLLPAEETDVAETVAPQTTVTTPIVVDTTTTLVDTSTAPPAATVEVPALNGLTVAQARAVLDDLGLELDVTEQYPSRSGFGIIKAQGPLAGETAVTGSTVVVGIRVEAPCLSGVAAPEVPAGSMAVDVRFECAGDGLYPDVSTQVTRAVPNNPNVIEATLQALLAGLTEDELATGFGSFFSADSAEALNSVRVDGNRLTVDFNDGILINNAGTSTGSMYFLAELAANLFQFDAVDEIVFQLNESCDAFWGWLQSDCTVATRADWEASLAAWNAERSLIPEPGQEVRLDDIVGRTFATQLGEPGQDILLLEDGKQMDAGFTEVDAWLLDGPGNEPATSANWALHAAGLNEEMVWLVESGERTDDGSTRFEVRATLLIPWDEMLPLIEADPFVLNGAEACTRAGNLDPSLVAVAEIAENPDGSISQTANVLRAWRIDTESGTFNETIVDGIECTFQFT